MPIGARIRRNFTRPDPTLVAEFRELTASDVADAAGRFFIAGGIRHMGGGTRLFGPALPVLIRPGDHLMVHAAIDRARPGDVIVVSTGGDEMTAVIGEVMSVYAQTRGVAGFVIDGPVRDIEALAVPVFARGANPRAPLKAAPGEIGYPVAIGGVVVSPGDMVVADLDGVVVIPQADAAVVAAKTRTVVAGVKKNLEQIAAGNWDRSWVDAALKAAGVEEEQEG